jgi:hypothetical protein
MSIVLTRTQNIRAKANLDKHEIRGSRYGVLDAFLADTDGEGSIVSPELKEKYFHSIGSTIQTPVIDFDGGISLGSARSVTVADSENTSAMQSITSTTYSWGFTMVPGAYHNNEIGYQLDFEKKFWKYAYLFLSTLDSACATSLNTNKTQVHANTLSYSVTGDVVISPLDKELRLLREVDVMTEANDFFGDLRLVGNGGFQSIVARMQQYGKYNEVDQSKGLDGKTFHYSNRVADDTGHGATFYALNQGACGIMTRVDTEALARRRSAYAGYEWDSILFPILGLPVGTMYYESVGDWNAIAGAATAHLTAGAKEHYGFSVDVAVFNNYNSDIATRANPIMKFAVATS